MSAPAVTDRLLVGITLLAGAIILAALVFSPAPFLHDYAEWVYQSKILALKAADPAEVRGFVLHAYPVPYMLVQYSLAVLHLAVPPFLAAKLFIIAYLAGSGLVCWAFVRRFVAPPERRPVAWVLLACIAGTSSYFWYGFIGYQVAMLIFAGFLTLYRASSSAWLVVLFSVLAFFAHATILMQVGLLVGLAVLFCRFPRTHLLGLLPAGLLSLWFLWGRHQSGTVMTPADAEFTGLLEAAIYKSGILTMQGPFKNFLLLDGSALLEAMPAIYWLGVAANLIVVAALGLLFCAALLRIARGGLPPADEGTRLLWLFATCAVMVYIIAPFNFFGIVHPGGRMILPFLFTGVALLYARGLYVPRALSALCSAGTLCTALAYLLTVSSVDSLADAAESARSKARPQATRSVLAADEARYQDTRYSYYNYRIFAFANRYAQLQREEYQGMSFATGPISHYDRQLQHGADPVRDGGR